MSREQAWKEIWNINNHIAQWQEVEKKLAVVASGEEAKLALGQLSLLVSENPYYNLEDLILYIMKYSLKFGLCKERLYVKYNLK